MQKNERAQHPASARNRRFAEDDLDAGANPKSTGQMTKRGTRYWDSGAIPLIAPEMLGDIISEIADLSIVVSDEGKILSVLTNPSQDRFRSLEMLEGQHVTRTLSEDSVAKFQTRFSEFVEGNSDKRPVELNHQDAAGRWSFPIRYTFHRIGPDGAVLMLGRDLRPVAEMQQELVKAQMALERDFELQRESDTRFRVVMESTTEAFVFVSMATGRITDANSVAATLMGRSRDDVAGQPFAPEFEIQKRGDLIEMLNTHAMAERSTPVPAKLARSGTSVKLVPNLFRAGGERLLLCRIDAEEGVRARTDSLTRNLEALYAQGPDAIVFAQQDGTILSANDGFLDLINAAHDINVRGRNLSDYFLRGSVDLKVQTENAARAGRMRLYPTKIAGDYGAPRPVEIAVTALDAGESRIFGFLMRDASRIEQVRPVAAAPVTDDNVRSVMELVGNATLKEIVAETTNVVERMCIETAVELTMNNRVAAAEMLGLSRQSLYVKLRKYGLLSRSSDDD